MWLTSPHAKIFQFVIIAICDVTYSQATHMNRSTWNVSKNIRWQIGLSVSTHLWVLTFWFRFFLSKTSCDFMENLYNFKTIRDRHKFYSFFHTRRVRLREVRVFVTLIPKGHIWQLWLWQIDMHEVMIHCHSKHKTFIKLRPNGLYDVGSTLYKWYTNVLCYWCAVHSAVISQNIVSVYFSRKQILPSRLGRQNYCVDVNTGK